VSDSGRLSVEFDEETSHPVEAPEELGGITGRISNE